MAATTLRPAPSAMTLVSCPRTPEPEIFFVNRGGTDPQPGIATAPPQGSQPLEAQPGSLEEQWQSVHTLMKGVPSDSMLLPLGQAGPPGAAVNTGAKLTAAGLGMVRGNPTMSTTKERETDMHCLATTPGTQQRPCQGAQSCCQLGS